MTWSSRQRFLPAGVLLVVFDVLAADGGDEQTERDGVRRRERFIARKEHEGPNDG